MASIRFVFIRVCVYYRRVCSTWTRKKTNVTRHIIIKLFWIFSVFSDCHFLSAVGLYMIVDELYKMIIDRVADRRRWWAQCIIPKRARARKYTSDDSLRTTVCSFSSVLYAFLALKNSDQEKFNVKLFIKSSAIPLTIYRLLPITYFARKNCLAKLGMVFSSTKNS